MHLGICQNPIFSVQASSNSHKISVAIGIESILLKRSVVCSLDTCSVTIPVELLLDVVSGISRKVIF